MHPIPRPLLSLCPGLASVMGLAYLTGDPARTASQSFAAARQVAPMTTWGLLFLTGALVLAAALLAGHRHALAWALFIGGGIYSWWAICFAASALHDPTASATAWAIHGFISASHYLAAWAVWTGRVA
ncbi:hypothetical protein QWY28_13190 [Nocardioides sp. SOB77]|uniref:DUF998 domain-containing protein n=1 Tax=Nocardioides oceani TaxID=3058369 RepID=A0ABT8FH35_9ACTN|nr:hypothetical protein [Nocardioides oceani]MDN4173909.1 hypothetical protein [Nocardioides oceani]